MASKDHPRSTANIGSSRATRILNMGHLLLGGIVKSRVHSNHSSSLFFRAVGLLVFFSSSIDLAPRNVKATHTGDHTILLSMELSRQGSSEATSGPPFVADEVPCRLDKVTCLNAKWCHTLRPRRQPAGDFRPGQASRFGGAFPHHGESG